MPAGKTPKDVEADLERLLTRELEGRSVRYTRSNGSSQPLTLGEVLARREDLEMAYNLNDCVEYRWGARIGSVEASTCQGRAPEEQRARMAVYRAWFRERRRPARP